ncbi:MAG: type II toxin-antitoxin system CcdA family antitoxin [Pseudonocardia sp.]|nr:type II toxin-antitoxin system CcdA family antitoxin [Pseudonocardia sp.]
MAKQKVSVTLSPERIERARTVTGRSNLSELLDDALDAVVERELERQWLAVHDRSPAGTDLPGEIVVDLADVPWDER